MHKRLGLKIYITQIAVPKYTKLAVLKYTKLSACNQALFVYI